jgi:tyrosine-protein kinase Etk/Wzc
MGGTLDGIETAKGDHLMTSEPTPVTEQEIDLLDLSLIFLKRKKFILGGTLAFVIIAIVAFLVVSPMYEGTSILMPPQQSAASMSAQLMTAVGGALGGLVGGGMTTTGDLYVGLLKTPTVLDPIIDQFDLMQLYGLDTRVETRIQLSETILTALVDNDNGGIVAVTVQDTDPQRAANMANAFVQQLTKLFDRVTDSEAGRRRVFFEKELKSAHEALSNAEDQMRAFQEASGVIRIDDQASAVLQGIAALKAQIAAKEVQIQVMKTYATVNNPDLKKVEEEVQALREQSRKLEEREKEYLGDTTIATGRIPELGTEYLRRIREFKYRQELYELLIKQYEAARLDEARESGLVQIVTAATPPDKKAKPKMILVVALALVLGFILFATWGFVYEFLERVRDNPKNEKGVKDFKRMLTRL